MVTHKILKLQLPPFLSKNDKNRSHDIPNGKMKHLQSENPVRLVRGGVVGVAGSEDIETRHGMDPCSYQLPQPAPVSRSGDKIKLTRAGNKPL